MPDRSEDAATEVISPEPAPRKVRWFGIFAILLGVVALGCSVVAYHVLEEPRPQTRSKISIQIKGFKWERETKSPPNKPDLEAVVTPYQLRLVAIGIAVLAVLLSALSWIRREGFWLGFAACIFAAAGVAWIVFVVVFAVLLISGGIFIFLPESPPARVPSGTVRD